MRPSSQSSSSREAGWPDRGGERRVLDLRSLRSGCESPLKALLFGAFSDGVFRSLALVPGPEALLPAPAET